MKVTSLFAESISIRVKRKNSQNKNRRRLSPADFFYDKIGKDFLDFFLGFSKKAFSAFLRNFFIFFVVLLLCVIYQSNKHFSVEIIRHLV